MGYDSISNELLKLSTVNILNIILKFMNLCLQLSLIPPVWCLSLINPIHCSHPKRTVHPKRLVFRFCLRKIVMYHELRIELSKHVAG